MRRAKHATFGKARMRGRSKAESSARQTAGARGTTPPASIAIEEGTLLCTGAWTLGQLPDLQRQIDALTWPSDRTLIVDASGVTALDTAGAVCLRRAIQRVGGDGGEVSVEGLQPDLASLFDLIGSHLEAWTPEPERPTAGRLERLGRRTWYRLEKGRLGLTFLGESAVGLLRLLTTPRLIRWRALVRSLETDGFQALPIVGLLTFLMGVVIAYQGAEQLRTFGANIFVVDLVGVSLLREIAPLVTAILVAGRSGSAYAAQIGTMKVTEELDAIRTLGISPLHLLVMPKVLALVIAMPLLTVFADVVGVFGGMIIASTQLDVSFTEFVSRFEEAVALRHFLIGVGKAPVFAIIVGLVGCYQGFQIRGGVDDVGRHTTMSVVQSIFLVIVFDAFFSVVLSWWGK